MAILRNITSNIEINLILLKSKESEWLNYRVEVFIIDKSGEKKIIEQVSLFNESNLFLDAVDDPEVINIIQGINRIINREIHYYSFTPVDEKDFILEVIHTDNFYVNFFTINNLTSFWEGIRIRVDKIALIDFMNELSDENNKLALLHRDI